MLSRVHPQAKVDHEVQVMWHSHFSGKGYYFGLSLEKNSREIPEEESVFLELPMVTNTRDRGVQLMGNKHRYPLGLWEGGGGGIAHHRQPG